MLRFLQRGDVDANEIDAATGVRIADWCICELIRLSHTISLEEAQAICDAIAVRQLPQIWDVFGKTPHPEPQVDVFGTDPAPAIRKPQTQPCQWRI